MNSNAARDRLYAIVFLLVLVLGVAGACVAGAAAFLFLPRPLHQERQTPSPTFLTPTPVVISPQETPTPSVPTPTPTPSGTSSTLAATPPPTPVSGYAFSILRISEPPPCEQRSLIRGRVFNARGEGLGNVRVRLFNDWGYSVFFNTWEKDLVGYYEFFMGPGSSDFRLEILDQNGARISPVANVHYEAGCISTVDWRRSY